MAIKESPFVVILLTIKILLCNYAACGERRTKLSSDLLKYATPFYYCVKSSIIIIEQESIKYCILSQLIFILKTIQILYVLTMILSVLYFNLFLFDAALHCIVM